MLRHIPCGGLLGEYRWAGENNVMERRCLKCNEKIDRWKGSDLVSEHFTPEIEYEHALGMYHTFIKPKNPNLSLDDYFKNEWTQNLYKRGCKIYQENRASK